MVGSPWLVVVSAGWSECPSKVQAMIDTVQADRTGPQCCGLCVDGLFVSYHQRGRIWREREKEATEMG
jgi:hypothetical protein